MDDFVDESVQGLVRLIIADVKDKGLLDYTTSWEVHVFAQKIGALIAPHPPSPCPEEPDDFFPE
jgi:hypothetical protein